MEQFKDRLAQAMQIRNISAAELSKKSGLSKAQISQYVNGIYQAKQVALYKLATTLNVSEAWLMGHDVPKERIVPTDSELSRRYRAAAETLSDEHLEKLTELTTLAGSLSMEQLEMAISYMKFLGGNG